MSSSCRGPSATIAGGPPGDGPPEGRAPPLHRAGAGERANRPQRNHSVKLRSRGNAPSTRVPSHAACNTVTVFHLIPSCGTLVRMLVLLGSLGVAVSAADLPAKMGDFDGDHAATVLDLERLINHLNGAALFSTNLLILADVNQDGVVNGADVPALVDTILGRTPLRALPDSDGDGLPDAWESLLGLDPHNSDSNGNGVLDGDEDSDHDGLKNSWEVRYGYDPRDPSTRKYPSPVGGFVLDGEDDPDNDRLTNAQEIALGTNPFLADTDGDGWSDEAEITGQGNPLDPNVGPRLFVSGAPPLAALVTGPGRLPDAALGTFVAAPPTSILVPGLGETTQLALGVVVALPPLTLLAPGLGVLDSVSLGTVMAQPPLTLLAPGLGPLDLINLGTVIAQPPFNLLVPGTGPGESAAPGMTFALPPVSIRINP